MLIHTLSIETPNGVTKTFTSPIPWTGGKVTPTVNGRLRSTGYVLLDQRTLVFDEPPGIDDVVGFFVAAASS